MGRGRKEGGQWVPAALATAREGSSNGVEEKRTGDGMGKGWGGRTGAGNGGEGDAMGPAIQLWAAHPFVPLRTKGHTGG